MKNLRIRIFFAWYDFWIGWYFDRKDDILYIGLLPMIMIQIWNEKHTELKIIQRILEEPYG